MGESVFWSIQSNVETYSEPKPPHLFLFVYSVFLELYNHSGESITWTEIESYGNIRQIKFKQYEIDLILKMNGWASQEIAELKKDE